MARTELFRLPFSFWSSSFAFFIDNDGSRAHLSHKLLLQQLLPKPCDEFQIRQNVLRAARLEVLYFLRSDFCKFRLWSTTPSSERSRMHDLQTRFIRTSFKDLSLKLAKCPFCFVQIKIENISAKKSWKDKNVYSHSLEFILHTRR